MDYLFRQHHRLQPQASHQAPLLERTSPVVILAEPEPEALALYARHLSTANLLVNVCMVLDQLPRQVQEVRPHLLIVNPGSDMSLALSVFGQISSLLPSLPIITVGAPIPDFYLDRLMAAGVTLHINRTLSQPRDIAVAARQILGLT